MSQLESEAVSQSLKAYLERKFAEKLSLLFQAFLQYYILLIILKGHWHSQGYKSCFLSLNHHRLIFFLDFIPAITEQDYLKTKDLQFNRFIFIEEYSSILDSSPVQVQIHQIHLKNKERNPLTPEEAYLSSARQFAEAPKSIFDRFKSKRILAALLSAEKQWWVFLNNFTQSNSTSTQKQRSIFSIELVMKRQAPDLFEEEQRELRRQLTRIERQIAYLQEQYLTRTKFCGNILTGFSSYIIEKTLLIHSDDKVRLQRSERLFSLSSMTSPISRAQSHELPEKINPQRITRNSLKNNQIEAEQGPQQAQSIQEMSIDQQYSRQGSLNKHPQSSERFLPDYRSAGDISRTLSEDSHFYSRDTEELSEAKSKPKKRPKAQTAEKKTTRRVLPENRMNEEQQSSITKVYTLKKEGESIVEVKNQMKAETNEEAQQDQDSESLDSVELFMRMAHK